jgi:hypothetical protein
MFLVPVQAVFVQSDLTVWKPPQVAESLMIASVESVEV